jgi:hypothetical protein
MAGMPNTNNSLERFNNSLKKYVTKRQRLSLSRLLHKASKELSYQSRRNASKKDVPTVPVLQRKDWAKAQVWSKENKSFLLQVRAPGMFFAPSTELLEATSRSKPRIQAAFKLYDTNPLPQNENFDAYIKRQGSFWKLQQLHSPFSEVTMFSCNCPWFLQYRWCKHSLGLAISRVLVQVPPEWKVNSLEQAKKRGRPTKANGCYSK